MRQCGHGYDRQLAEFLRNFQCLHRLMPRRGASNCLKILYTRTGRPLGEQSRKLLNAMKNLVKLRAFWVYKRNMHCLNFLY